jgi:hypothetical protein
MVTMVVQLLLAGSLILMIAMPIVLAVLVCMRLRTRGCGRGVLVALSFVLGACGGGILTWNLVPSDWSMPFRTTLEASVNAEKYGHVIERAAESILTVVTFACVFCGILSGITAAAGPKILARLRHG